jgi:hypothetical protein
VHEESLRRLQVVVSGYQLWQKWMFGGRTNSQARKPHCAHIVQDFLQGRRDRLASRQMRRRSVYLHAVEGPA